MIRLKYVIEAMRRKEEQEKLPVLRMEIDYELLTLYEAMQDEDKVKIIKTKERLLQLSRQLQKIENDALL
ncbi:hypothetical protein [Virgibacillus sp. MG-45]|uniref:hypothetical protein n=1 Tax=Virgibacillus sp. MG-45 TaxID=3102791 RepID=UPI002ED92DBE